MRINEFTRVEESEQNVWPLSIGELFVITKGQGEPVQVELLCPCGCGDVLILPVHCQLLKKTEHASWIIEYSDGIVSLSPSILQHRCGAHYFIRENKIIWCEGEQNT